MSGKRSARCAFTHNRWLGFVILAISLSPVPRAVYGQVASREYPPAAYYLAFSLLDEGDFVTALRTFRSASKAGVRTTQGRWIDSVCYATMMGECFYQMGQLQQLF